MDGSQASYYTVLEESTKDTFLCCIKNTSETYTVWSALGPGGSAVLLLQASGEAELRVNSGTADLSLPLARLDQPQARAEVKELLFGMAALLAQSGRQQAAAQSVSPGKSQYRSHDTGSGMQRAWLLTMVKKIEN
ncbi:hypothetical protein CRUP_012421 [Coryphaenoides rupestris]|nr:hypothetical protein CRUP_012421 [Coryphaenoides rupestris]